MQVQKHVAQHHQRPGPAVVGRVVAEDGPPDLGVGDSLPRGLAQVFDFLHWSYLSQNQICRRSQMSRQFVSFNRQEAKSERPPGSGELDERLRILPLPSFELERAAFVNEKLPVIGQGDLDPLERPRSRSFEIDARHVEPATVTRTFELALGFQPVRRTTEVGTNGLERVDTFFVPHNPNPEFFLESLVDRADGEIAGRPTLKVDGGSVRTLGNMNLKTAIPPAAEAAAKAAQAVATQLMNARRVTFSFFSSDMIFPRAREPPMNRRAEAATKE